MNTIKDSQPSRSAAWLARNGGDTLRAESVERGTYGQRWTEEADDRVMHDPRPLIVLAREMGRTYNAILGRRRYLQDKERKERTAK